MKIKKNIIPKIELHIDEEGLSLISEGEILSKGFTDVGTIRKIVLVGIDVF